MKNLYYISLILITVGCNSDGVGCFTPSGAIETIVVALPDYTTIDVSSNIDLHLSNSINKELKLTTGSNLSSGIRMEVVGGVLYLENLNSCNWTRKYNNPVIEISNPDLISIIQHGFGKTLSLETLTYEELKLESNEGSGEFNLDVDINNLTIVSNEVANYNISGIVENLSVGYYYCDGIFYGENLVVQNCSVTHWGSNTIHLNVVNSIGGIINSFGNVVLHKQLPASIDVEEINTGRLIFEQ